MNTRAIYTRGILAILPVLCACTLQSVHEKYPPPSLRPITAEVCGDAVAGAPLTIAESMVEATRPVIQSDGTRFAVAYAIHSAPRSRIRLLQLDGQGGIADEGILFPSEGRSRSPSIDGDASAFYLSWLEDAQIKAVKVGTNEENPVLFGQNVQHAVSGPWGALAWVESGTLLFRNDGMLPSPNLKGARREPRPIEIAQGAIEDPAIAWTGNFHAVTWSVATGGGRQIMMQRVLNDGNLMGPVVKVSGVAGISRKPVVVWTGWEFGIAWTTAYADQGSFDNQFRIFFAVVPEKAVAPSLTRQLDFSGSADDVAIATSGSEFVLAWVGSHPSGSAVFAQRIEKNGTPVGKTEKLNEEGSAVCGRPAIAFARDGYGVVWHEGRDDATYRILFSRISCTRSSPGSSETDAPSTTDTDNETATDELKEVF